MKKFSITILLFLLIVFVNSSYSQPQQNLKRCIVTFSNEIIKVDSSIQVLTDSTCLLVKIKYTSLDSVSDIQIKGEDINSLVIVDKLIPISTQNGLRGIIDINGVFLTLTEPLTIRFIISNATKLQLKNVKAQSKYLDGSLTNPITYEIQ